MLTERQNVAKHVYDFSVKSLETTRANKDFAVRSPADVEHVLVELGAEINERSGAKFAVTLGGHTANFHHASHSLPKDEVRQMRKFLESAGVDPERDYPL